VHKAAQARRSGCGLHSHGVENAEPTAAPERFDGFYTGPQLDAASIESEWPDHYQRLLDAGFVNPYAEQADVECTLCPDNALRNDDSDPKLIDHILWKNAPAATHTTRFMTETVTLDLEGQSVDSNHSDHYGLVCGVEEWCAP